MKRPVRILHLIKSLGRGGAEMLLPEGLRFADRDRFEYRYAYFLPWKDALVPTLRELGAEVTCLPARSSARILLSAGRLARLIRAWRIDLVHCHLPIAGVTGRVAGRLAGVPVIYTEHNKLERYHPWTRRLNLATWRWQDRVIAVSAGVAESIRAHVRSGVPVDVVLNGVDVERFRRDAVEPGPVREELGIPPGAPVVGTVAVFRVQKRLDLWLEAAREIRESCPDAHFIVVGDGPLREELVRKSVELGLTRSVHFPGLREDVRPYLAAMDVYLMSSIFEGLPVALLEAMSMGCVPVCTAVGGIPEVVRSGENGWLTEAGDVRQLAARAVALLRDGGRRDAYARAARATIQREFGMARMTAELESIYEGVIGRGGGNGR